MTTAIYVNTAPHPLMLWDGRVVSACASFEAHTQSHYLRGLLAAGLAVAAEPDDTPVEPAPDAPTPAAPPDDNPPAPDTPVEPAPDAPTPAPEAARRRRKE